ncbi:hypothetical protein NSE01_06080 [Novosphingobium sediminis]|uniref:Uncharacterized protein n=1 Tax=Novosphingobium sediminis TaxID=707214 RepID=A0A512AGE1_9SPHN|nr:hypothetical protein [Novosphingobium sediminis]GEN98775.1 hypothetical protein NSE01_06080 [Novosphingobium sediminis]
MKEDYLKLALLNAICKTDFVETTKKWLPVERMEDIFHKALARHFQDIGIEIGDKYKDIVNIFIDDLKNNQAIFIEGDEFTGHYFKMPISNVINYYNIIRSGSEVGIRISNLGDGAFTKALINIARSDGVEMGKYDQEIESNISDVDRVSSDFPASDRTVSLNHNQISQFDEQTSELIDAVERLNGIDGESGFREIIIGQLKAGRELIRAGNFKLYALQWTLIEGLKFLALRYEKETVGALAGALLAVLVKQVGLG